MRLIKALSLTPAVNDWLVHSRPWRILHIFDQACNLISEDREILSIVTPQTGNGPFTLVIADTVVFTRYLDAESKVYIHDKRILLGDLTILLMGTQMWNSIPKWDELRNNKEEIINRLRVLQIDNENESILQFSNVLSFAIIKADIPAIKNIASKLAGLGIGLTPAGDDFLMGAMYATWIIHPQKTAKKITEEIANIATPLTTSLSSAWLQSAARGEAGKLWHEFFDALIEDKNIYLPMSKILSVGETSGSDALAGFLGVLASWA